MRSGLQRLWNSVVSALAGRDQTPRGWQDDFVRVYPGGVCFDPSGRPHAATEFDRRNWLNHVKFYRFAAQFARGRKALDVGCGSGYGCEILADSGAEVVCGCDISDHALAFARGHFGNKASFEHASCTDLSIRPGGTFSLVICSEVLEHLQGDGEVDRALVEMKRIVLPGAVFVLGVPNIEMVPGHGFAFARLRDMCKAHFRASVVFENAFVPAVDAQLHAWHERQKTGNTGVIVTENIVFEDSARPGDLGDSSIDRYQLKTGTPAGTVDLGGIRIDTTLLHNTHSFIVVATA